MPNTLKLSSLFAVLALAGCVTVPTGPSVMVLPGTGKSFDQFRYDEGDCRHYAHAQVGGTTATQAAEHSAVRSAVIGTAVGALAGAAIDGGSGAGVGAGVGLLAGSVAGAGAAQGSAYELQRRYDYAYQQCMYAKGHRVPTAARYSPSERRYTPPASSYTPPPPPPPSSSSQRPPPPPPQ